MHGCMHACKLIYLTHTVCVYLFSILYVTTQNTAWVSRKRPQDKFDESKYAFFFFFSFLFHFESEACSGNCPTAQLKFGKTLRHQSFTAMGIGEIFIHHHLELHRLVS